MIQLDDYGWHNEMNSWKCGLEVFLETCAYPADSKANQGDVHPKDGDAGVRKEACNSGMLHNRAMGPVWADSVD